MGAGSFDAVSPDAVFEPSREEEKEQEKGGVVVMWVGRGGFKGGCTIIEAPGVLRVRGGKNQQWRSKAAAGV